MDVVKRSLAAKSERDYGTALALFRQALRAAPPLFDSEKLWAALFNAPDWFVSDDDAESYLEFADAIMAEIQEVIAGLAAKDAVAIAHAFVNGAHFRLTVHNRRPLTSFMARRAALFRAALAPLESLMDYSFPTAVSAGGKLRYGILLKHLRQDPETIGALSYFEYGKSSDVEVLVFVTSSAVEPGFAARVRASADQVTVLPETLSKAVKELRLADLDVLFFAQDVSCKPSLSAYLTFFRVARRTFTCVATIATTAAPHLDAYMGGEYFQQQGLDKEFTERFISLPFPGFSFSIPVKTQVDPGLLSRERLGIPGDAVLLTSGANFAKLHGPLLRSWAEILRQLPNAYLIVYPFPPHFGPAQEQLAKRWLMVMAEAGADPERIQFLPSLGSREAVIALLKSADVGLDSFPYSGLTTIVDAIEAHLPVVVPSGPVLRNNHGAAIMASIGARHLIAKSTEDYIALAVSLAKDPARRAAWRQRMADVMGGPPSFLNPFAYCQAVIGACRMLYDELKAGAKPMGTVVNNDRDTLLKKALLLHAQGRLNDAHRFALQAMTIAPGDITIFQILTALRQEMMLAEQKALLGGVSQTISRIAFTVYQSFVRDLQRDERYADRKRLERFGYSIGSQNEEDGMLAEVFRRIGEGGRTFFEFGVGSGLQNNTYYFLLAGWKGWWIEINAPKVQFIRKHFERAIMEERLVLSDTPVDASNIEAICTELGIPDEIDLLSIDIDGNDYHVFAAMERVRARVVVMEYNAAFPPPQLMVGAYDPSYTYNPDTYIGASLQSLTNLAEKKGYQLVGCNITGLNCIFVRKDLARGKFAEPATPEHLYNSARHQLAWGGAFGSGPKANFGPLHTED